MLAVMREPGAGVAQALARSIGTSDGAAAMHHAGLGRARQRPHSRDVKSSSTTPSATSTPDLVRTAGPRAELY